MRQISFIAIMLSSLAVLFPFHKDEYAKITNRVMQEQVIKMGKLGGIYQQVALSVTGGMSAKGLWAAAQIESGGNPHSVNGKYAGLINMGEEEFKTYGPEYGDRMDPLHNLIAANFYVKCNSAILRNILKRQPVEGEMYLSLQQGRKGLSDLLENPKKLAVMVRGHDAIVGNVPDKLKKQAEKWTCAEFVNYWVNRFNEVASKSSDQQG